MKLREERVYDVNNIDNRCKGDVIVPGDFVRYRYSSYVGLVIGRYDYLIAGGASHAGDEP